GTGRSGRRCRGPGRRRRDRARRARRAARAAARVARRWRAAAGCGRAALDLENERDLHAAALLDLVVGIEEAQLEAPGEEAPDGRLAGPHQADQEDVPRLHPGIVGIKLGPRLREGDLFSYFLPDRKALVDDAGRDEHQELGLVVRGAGAAEEEP